MLRAPSSSSVPDSPGHSDEGWAERLRAVSVSKATMDSLVMNWLVIEGHQEAAQQFEEESGTDAGVDFDAVSDRMSIRAAMQSGDIRQAVERLDALDGAILSSNPELTFKLKQQQLIELIRAGAIEAALAFAQAELAPLAEDNPAFLDDLERTMLLLATRTPAGRRRRACSARRRVSRRRASSTRPSSARRTRSMSRCCRRC